MYIRRGYERVRKVVNYAGDIFRDPLHIFAEVDTMVEQATFDVINDRQEQIRQTLALEGKTYDYEYAIFVSYYAGELARRGLPPQNIDEVLYGSLQNQNTFSERTLWQQLTDFRKLLEQKPTLTADNIRVLATLTYQHRRLHTATSG